MKEEYYSDPSRFSVKEVLSSHTIFSGRVLSGVSSLVVLFGCTNSDWTKFPLVSFVVVDSNTIRTVILGYLLFLGFSHYLHAVNDWIKWSSIIAEDTNFYWGAFYKLGFKSFGTDKPDLSDPKILEAAMLDLDEDSFGLSSDVDGDELSQRIARKKLKSQYEFTQKARRSARTIMFFHIFLPPVLLIIALISIFGSLMLAGVDIGET